MIMNERALALATGNLSAGSLGSYIYWVNQVPLLSEEEERALSEKLQKNNDLESARRLIVSHLRFVVKIARGYAGYGLQLADLIQEGNVGLMKAVKRFDPAIGVRLVSFAVHWIKAEIHEFVLHNWRIVKVATTKAQRKLFFNLRQMKKRLGWLSYEEVSAVAEDLGVTREDVLVMEQRLNAMDASYDADDSDDDESAASMAVPARYLSSTDNNPADLVEQENSGVLDSDRLYAAMAQLDERSQDILQQRWLAGEKAVTLHTLADRYGVSAERVRQLEKNAMKKLRQY